MALPRPTAENYERLYPQTGVGEAQAQERMERKVFKAEGQRLLRTGRNRGIVVPATAPWPPERPRTSYDPEEAA